MARGARWVPYGGYNVKFIVRIMGLECDYNQHGIRRWDIDGNFSKNTSWKLLRFSCLMRLSTCNAIVYIDNDRLQCLSYKVDVTKD